MNILRALLVFHLVAAGSLSHAASGDAPSDFRGLEWGSSPTGALKKIEKNGVVGGQENWINPREKVPPYLGIPIDTEVYFFDNGKLCGGSLSVKGARNVGKIEGALNNEFGPPDINRGGTLVWRWPERNVRVNALYFSSRDYAWISIVRGRAGMLGCRHE